MPDLLPGYRVKIIDRNAFPEGVVVGEASRREDIAARKDRLKPLREINSAPLPGQFLVVFDPSLM